MENTKTTRLLFKGSWILTYFWHSRWHYFGYISGKVAKPHFLENPQKSLKTRQHSYQKGPPITKKRPFRNMKNLRFFFCGSYFLKKLLTFGIFNEIFGQRFIIFEKLRYRAQLLLKIRAVEVATSFHWI